MALTVISILSQHKQTHRTGYIYLHIPLVKYGTNIEPTCIHTNNNSSNNNNSEVLLGAIIHRSDAPTMTCYTKKTDVQPIPEAELGNDYLNSKLYFHHDSYDVNVMSYIVT